jgi:hypothetical protein
MAVPAERLFTGAMLGEKRERHTGRVAEIPVYEVK